MSPIKNATVILKDLITISSDSANRHEDMSHIISRVSEFLKDLDCELIIGGEKNSPALLARCGKNAERGVLFSGHLDTVPIGDGWTKGQGEVEEGIMYGRGASDMKGGCAAILLAAERLAADEVPFSILFTTDEETTMKGAELMAASVKDSRAVVIAEPTDFNVVFREKGLYQFSITTKGIAAHASLPWLGENAIAKMGSVINALRQMPVKEDEVADILTINPDIISGGEKINVIPDTAYLEVDVRYPASMDREAVERYIEKRLEKAGMGKGDYEITVLHHLPPVKTDPNREEIKTMLKMAEGSLISVPYATEMVMFHPYNERIMVCGPGEPGQAHVVDEKIRIEDVERAADMYYRYASYFSP